MTNITINWTAISAIATSVAVIVAMVSLVQTRKDIQENLRIAMFDKYLEGYFKIIKPYFQIFKLSEEIKDKCNDYLSGNKKQINSIHHILSQQFLTIATQKEKYLDSYKLTILGSKIVMILSEIDNTIYQIDHLILNEAQNMHGNIQAIKKQTENLLKLRTKLAKQISTLFNINKKTFCKFFILDTLI